MNQLITSIITTVSLYFLIGTDKIEYPIPPKNIEQLFYIQRNHNKNTIVYDANFDEEGNLDENDPIKVYWIRYEEDGQKMELRKIEKLFAYGVQCKADINHDKQYIVKLAANNKKELLLIQRELFNASIYAEIDNSLSQLGHMYIYADNSGLWPKVKYIELFGKDIKTGEINYEKILY